MLLFQLCKANKVFLEAAAQRSTESVHHEAGLKRARTRMYETRERQIAFAQWEQSLCQLT